MSTGSPFVDFTPNRLIEIDDLKDRLFDYLDDQEVQLAGRVYDSSGVFGSLTLDTSTPGEFDILGSVLCADGLGRMLDPSVLIASCQDVTFENTAAVTYEISLRWNEAPWVDTGGSNTIRANADTGAPEYIARANYIGEAGLPDNVQLIGSDLTFTIDSLCEAGVSHAGRQALIYLVTPQAVTSVVGLPIETVVWSGGQNKAVVLATKLGQVSASTTVSDYRVVLLGPTVRRNVSQVGVPGYVIIGSVTDEIPDTSAQVEINVSLSNLNDAFNTFAQDQSFEGAGSKATQPEAMWAAASVVYGTDILTFGGIKDTSDESVNTNQIHAYDSVNDAWSTKIPTIADAFTSQLAAAVVGDVVYIAGGHDGATVSDALRRYDADADAFLGDGAVMPAARHGGALVAHGGFLYYIAGDAEVPGIGSLPQTSVYRYEIDLDQWSAVADLPVAKARVRAVASSSKLYAMGGSTSNFISGIDESCHAFDPTQNSWGTLSSMPRKIRRPFGDLDDSSIFRPALVISGNAIHSVCGAGSEAGAFAAHQIYSIEGDAWSVAPHAHTAHRYGPSFGLVSSVLYMFGGVVIDSPVTSHVDDLGFACDLIVTAATADGAAIGVGSADVNPDTASDSAALGMFDARVGHSVCRLGEALLITGGADSIAGTYVATAELYWPQTQTQCRIQDMPDVRALHGSVEFGGQGIVLAGKVEPNLTDNAVWRYRPENNTWAEIVADADGPQRSSYGLARDGNVVYLIGGNDSNDPVQTPLEDVEAWSLESMRSLGVVAEMGAPISHIGATALDGVLYAAWSTLLRAIPTRQLDNDGSLNSFLGIKGVVLPGVTNAPALATWAGRVYVYDPDGSRLIEYDPGTFTITIVATGLPTQYRARMDIRNGRAYIIGGSSVVGMTNNLSTIHEVVIPKVQTREVPTTPSNFSTELTAQSVGFKANQLYGVIAWSAQDAGDMIRMSAEI